ncbi:MAG TPA: glycosyltransferase family 2 protein [Candidatus Lokiarchaeia archaeon]|nr:glycosyltransferase family 2 protein [Candidatus Lokiarchaeia archaeon]
MRVSVIIITLNEAENIENTVVAARAAAQFDSGRAIPIEIVVSDGGSTDNTVQIAKGIADKVIETARGRSNQLNIGARAASGDILVFLHADTLLPKGAIARLLHEYRDPSLIGGGFEKDWQWSPNVARSSFVNAMTYFYQGVGNWVFTLLKKIPGDNAIFVKRRDFEEMGGYKNLWMCEDYDFSQQMVDLGKKRSKGFHKFHVAPMVTCIQEHVLTSTRRFEKYGLLKTIMIWFQMYLMWRIGLPQDRIQRHFSHYSTIPERPDVNYVKF